MNTHHTRNRIVSLADLATRAPDVYNLLGRMNTYRRRRRAVGMAQRAGWFAAGIAVGSGLTTLLAPNSGAEMRRRVSAGAHRVREYVAPKGNGEARAEAP